MRNEKKGRLLRTAIATAGAVGLALLGVTAIAGPASATTTPPVGNITGTTGTLVVHKSAHAPGDAGDGTLLNPAPGPGLNGVTFDVARVSYNNTPIDLLTTAGWNLVPGAALDTQGNLPSGYTAGAATSQVTANDGSEDGVATFNSLPYGLYYVTEGADTGGNNIVSPAQPFLVSIPYPHSAGADSSWLYTVNTYPKNVVDATTPTKSVGTPTTVIMDGVTQPAVDWTITKTVPPIASTDTYRSLTITDPLDQRLTPTAVSVTLNGNALAAGTDYTLTPSTLPGAAGSTVKVEFTGALKTVKAGDSVAVTITSAISGPGADGQIPNTATVEVNGVSHPTNTPQTNWGPLQIIKTNVATGATLKGAIFQIYKSDKTTPVGGQLTTDDNGEINVDGLWVSNDAATLTATYWVKEVQAPVGYILPTGNDAWTQVTVHASGATNPTKVTISDTQVGPLGLPLTGSTGTLLYVGGGIALIAIALGAALVIARRKRATVAHNGADIA